MLQRARVWECGAINQWPSTIFSIGRQNSITEQPIEAVPQITIQIVAVFGDQRRALGKYLHIDSEPVFEAIESLGFEETTKNPKGSLDRYLNIAIKEDDPRIFKIQKILEDYGMVHYPHRFERRAFYDREYSVHRERVYSREEICQAELLRLAGSERKFAEFAPDRTGEVYVVEISQHLKNKIDFGRSYYHVSVLMSEKLKTALKATKLAAVKFKEASYEKPRRPGFKSLWQFGSTVRMPACKTRRQDTHGDFVSEDGPPAGKLGYYWDDAGFQPAELVYSRAAVEQLPRFDIAMTQEFVGEPFAPYREIIVTQRFREAMEKHGVKTALWAPVRLV